MSMVQIPPAHFSRARLVVVLLLVGWVASLAAACDGSSLAGNAQGPLTCAPPASGGTPPGPGSYGFGPCCGMVAREIQVSELADGSVETCPGTSVYARCNGAFFDCEYLCSPPSGYTVLPADASQSCPEAGGVDAPSSRAVPFDGGGLELGPCSGHVVALIPAASCPARCPGSLAYAVCEGTAYTECACNIPPGYTLVALSEGSAPDATSEAAGDAPPSDAGFDALVDAGKESGGG
jgi:hypothetical protein